MAQFEFGNMWNSFHETDAFCITTNSYIRKDGEVVMGRGIAKQTKNLFEDLPLALGNKIKNRCGHLGTYGVLPTNRNENDKFVAFQVKTHFKNDATVSLIENSAKILGRMAFKYQDKRFDLNFPGIGNGGLNQSEVKPVVEDLPQNVHVWRFKNQK
jgi:hypothetical protein